MSAQVTTGANIWSRQRQWRLSQLSVRLRVFPNFVFSLKSLHVEQSDQKCTINFNIMEVLVVEVNTYSSVKQRNKKNITRLREISQTVPEK